MYSHKQTMDVIINIYDLIPQNNYTYSLGIGAFHSGIEINGIEYSFGNLDQEGVSGVFECPPKSVLPLRQTIILGDVYLSMNELNSIIDELKPQFLGTSYHPIKKNCNHFSNAFCKQLLNKPIPNYVNRLAWLGSFVSCLLPPEFQDKIKEESPQVQQQTRFPGEAIPLSSQNNNINNEDLQTRRERHAKAAMLRMQNQQ